MKKGSSVVQTTMFGSFDAALDALTATGLYSREEAERQLNMAEYEAEMQEFMKQKKKQLILKRHKEAWPWWQNTKGRWVTYVPDASKPNKRRQISASVEASLEDKVFDFYQAKEPASTLTLRILFPEWLEAKSEDVKAHTIKRIKTDWVRYYDEASIVDVPLGKLTTDSLKSFTKSVTAGQHLDRHQFGNFSLIIRQMMDYAYEKGYIPADPYRKVKVKWSALSSGPKKSEAKLVFKREEQPVMINYCWDKYKNNAQFVQHFVPLAIIFDFYTGLRIGELAAVKFSDIDTDNCIMKVQRMVEYESRKVVSGLKEDTEYRYVPLFPEAVEVIEEVKRKRLELGLPVDGYVFAVNEPINTYTQTQKLLREYCVKLKMLPRSPHDIRRTFISNLIDDNVDLNTVMTIAGHKQASTTLNSYAFAVREAKETVKVIRKAILG